MKANSFSLTDSAVSRLNEMTPTMAWSVYKDNAIRAVTVIARTKSSPELAGPLIRQNIKRQPCSWTYSRWARAIKWCLSKKYLRRLIPHPIEALVLAEEVAFYPEPYFYPSEVQDSIQAQIADLHLFNKQPMVIIVGHKAESVLLRLANFGLYQSFSPAGPDSEYPAYMGIPVIATQKIALNSVIVLPKPTRY